MKNVKKGMQKKQFKPENDIQFSALGGLNISNRLYPSGLIGHVHDCVRHWFVIGSPV